MVLKVNQNTFKHEVIGASVPVLVSFWAPWCGICRLVDPMLSKMQADCGTQIKCASINADENLKLANIYKLKTLPTVLLFHQGDVLCRLDQFRSKDDFQIAANDLHSALKAVLDRYSYSISA